MAVFDKLQHIRYFSQSVWDPKLGFYLRIFEFSFFWNFQIPENLEMAIFDKLQHIGYFFHLVLFTELDFSLRIFKFLFSLNFRMSKTAILRFPGIWNLEIPGEWKFENSEWNIKLSEQNYVEKIPNILQFVQKGQWFLKPLMPY